MKTVLTVLSVVLFASLAWGEAPVKDVNVVSEPETPRDVNVTNTTSIPVSGEVIISNDESNPVPVTQVNGKFFEEREYFSVFVVLAPTSKTPILDVPAGKIALIKDIITRVSNVYLRLLVGGQTILESEEEVLNFSSGLVVGPGPSTLEAQNVYAYQVVVTIAGYYIPE